ncbi:hypothetical protein PN472_16490 [Microcystis aeruginosa CS-1036]|nr:MULTISPECIES: hypothetical protein [Microcystis]MCA2622824.1 hypothetical protein [Microcystis sp. M19BS1]MCA2634938.1 hypothetical protein [Microcystis sp. M20BS1]MDB9544716.1 hypothetical protein [Microcystis aeruginosa CS-1036]
MTARQPRHSKEEFARRGDELYQSQVRSRSKRSSLIVRQPPYRDRIVE